MGVSPDRLHALRKAKKWSLRKLAEETGGTVSPSYISAIEKGKHPRHSTLVAQALADALGVPLEEIMGTETTLAHYRAKTEKDLLLVGFRRLPDEDREEILETIERKVQRHRRRLGERSQGQSHRGP